MKNVFQVDKQLEYLTDERVNPKYNTKQVILITLLGFLLRLTSINELNRYIKACEFNNIFVPGAELPKVDSIRNTLKKIDLEGLRRTNNFIVKKAIRNKVFEDGTIEDRVVAGIDGTQILDSKKKKCSSCLTMNKRGVEHYIHKL